MTSRIYTDPSDSFALPNKATIQEPVLYREDDGREFPYEEEQTQELDFDIIEAWAEGEYDDEE